MGVHSPKKGVGDASHFRKIQSNILKSPIKLLTQETKNVRAHARVKS